MECHDARLLLTLHRREPEQFDAAELDAIERHVDICPGCQNWNQSEARFETAVTTALNKIAVPADLKQKIGARLAQSRPPRRKMWTAIAAALLLTVSTGAFYFWTRPEAVDLDQFKNYVVWGEEQTIGPRTVQAYFADAGYSMTPPPFDFDYLVEYRLARSYDGRLVPRLTFQSTVNSNSVKAVVYCMPKNRYRVPSDAEVPSAMQILSGENDVYIVFCNGDLRVLQPSY